MANIARIIEIVEPEAQALGFDLVRVKIFGKSEAGGGISEAGDDERALQIMAERPDTGQLVIDDCAALSRRISDRIDEFELRGIELVEGAYRLEVSSPGIDRPLTRLSDYADWAGHEARIKLVEPIEGRKMFDADLKGVEGEDVHVVAKHGAMLIPFDAIVAAKLVLTDKLIKATKPLVSDGADKIIEEEID